MSGPHDILDSATDDESRHISDEGVRLQVEGRLEEAEARYQQALEIAPRNATALSNLGFLHAQRDRHEDAVECYKLALDIDEQRSLTHVNLGLSLATLGDHASAEAAFRRGIEIDPSNRSAWISLSRLLHAVSRPHDAEQLWRHALSHQPHDDEFIAALGAAIGAQGHVDEAIQVTEQAIAVRPRAGHWMQVGSLLMARRDLGSAHAAFRQALGLEPENIEARRQLALTLAAMGDAPASLAEFERIVRLEPKSPARVDLGVMRLAAADHDGAAEILADVLADVPDDERARFYHAVALQKLGRVDDARPEFESVRNAGGAHAEMASQTLDAME